MLAFVLTSMGGHSPWSWFWWF